MANEILMPVRYNGDNVGISVVVSNLDTTCNYGRISISLDNHKYEVNFNEEKTDIVTFNNLDQDRSYNIKALLNIDGEDVELSIKTIPSIANEIRKSKGRYL
jgi:hypothetical protein